MDDKIYTERRQFPRANIACKISVVFGERLLVFNCHTENIGKMGIRVILEEKLNISTNVGIELFLADRQQPLKCKGQIIWDKEINPTGIGPRFFDTGIKFTEISGPDKEDIGKLVDTLISQERK